MHRPGDSPSFVAGLSGLREAGGRANRLVPTTESPRARVLRQALDADADETGTRVDDEHRSYLALDREAEVR